MTPVEATSAPAHVALSGSAFVALAAAWLSMMTVMMAPTVWPWVLAFDRFAGQGSRLRRRCAAVMFSSGYLAAWALVAVAGASVELVWPALEAEQAQPPPLAAAAIFVVAGLYQFSSVKRACLTHCRSPFSYLLARWSNGPPAGFRLGFGHGVFCVGCCWALMATTFAVGVMNLWWMAALTVVVFVEQVLTGGDRLRAPLGLVLIAAGLLRAAGA